MKKFLKGLIITVFVLAAIGAAAFLVVNEAEPKGKTGDEADQMAERMLTALNDSAWNATRYVTWTFKGANNYLWDKEKNVVQVISSNTRVVLDANTITGKTYQDDVLLTGEAANNAVQSAWKSFCNDGFWVYAPFKVFDAGTVRSKVTLKDGTEALKVTYMEGGVTPGDSYVWILDENYRPKAWKLWVKIIPIGGVAFTWDNWVQQSSGAWLATTHHSQLLDLEISNLKTGQSLEDLGIAQNPF
jgi:hypothetical protein